MTRRPNPSDPTAERTEGQSTQTAGGLGGGRAPAPVRPRSGRGEPDRTTEQAHDVHEGEDELIPRNGEDRRDTPRRYEDDTNEAALPADDATVKTKI